MITDLIVCIPLMIECKLSFPLAWNIHVHVYTTSTKHFSADVQWGIMVDAATLVRVLILRELQKLSYLWRCPHLGV